MATLALQQVSSKFARQNAKKTLLKPVSMKYIAKYLTPHEREVIAKFFPYEQGYIWGIKAERQHQMERMPFKQCLVLFRQGSTVFKCGVLKCLIVNEALATSLWEHDKDGSTWEVIYFLEKVKDISIPAEKVNALLGRKPNDNWQGFNTVESPTVDDVIALIRSHTAKATSKSH